MFNLKEIFSVTLILFSVIDILGAIPFIISIRKREGRIHAEKATLISAGLMVSFLFLGQSILKLFGLDVASFAVDGANRPVATPSCVTSRDHGSRQPPARS